MRESVNSKGYLFAFLCNHILESQSPLHDEGKVGNKGNVSARGHLKKGSNYGRSGPNMHWDKWPSKKKERILMEERGDVSARDRLGNEALKEKR